jgi:hypothetical protein
MWCLQSALTFYRSDSVRNLERRGGRVMETLVGRRNTAHALHWGTLSGCTEGEDIETRSEMERGAPKRLVKSRVTPAQRVRCSQLLTHLNKRIPPQSLAMHPTCMKTTKKVELFPVRKRGSVTLRPKHLHHWYKSLAGGFRCACEVWRCEFAEGGNNCDSGAAQGRRYCLAHLASSTL